MTWLESIARWRALPPQEKTRIRLQRVPHQVAQSMSFEREPVSLARLEDLHRRLNPPRAESTAPAKS